MSPDFDDFVSCREGGVAVIGRGGWPEALLWRDADWGISRLTPSSGTPTSPRTAGTPDVWVLQSAGAALSQWPHAVAAI